MHVSSVRFPPQYAMMRPEQFLTARYVHHSPSSRSFSPSQCLFFLDKSPEFVEFDSSEGEVLLKEVTQDFGMLADQPVIPDNSPLVVAGYPRNTADRGFLHAMRADEFDIPLVQTGIVERSVFRLDEVLPAVFTEILLVPSTIPPILDDIFSFFDQKELTRGILTGHWAVTARTGHTKEY